MVVQLLGHYQPGRISQMWVVLLTTLYTVKQPGVCYMEEQFQPRITGDAEYSEGRTGYVGVGVV